MRTISQLLLNFLVNACWQIALIAAVAVLCSWLLRHAAPRQRHMLWVATLLMALGLPLLTSSHLLTTGFVPPPFLQQRSNGEVPPVPVNTDLIRASDENAMASPMLSGDPDPLRLNRSLALGLLGLYLFFLLYRGFKFCRAWRRTTTIKRSAHAIEPGVQSEIVFARCRQAIGVVRVRILCSAAVSVPITIGVRRPLVILPERLLREADIDVLTSAVGHELVHVLRRDYLLNLFYELIYLPLSFHPAAALVRRRINQTRELSCDKLVTEKLLAAEVYAHSLVQLAGSAMPFGRHATLTVGITDADILEVRIMSLLRKPKLNVRRRKLSLIAAALLLALPVVAASAFGVRLDIKSTEQPWEQDQESAKKREQKEMEEKKRAEAERKGESQGDESEMRRRREREEKEYADKERAERDPQFRAELEARSRHEQEERKAMLIAHAALARMAKITMEQAIQIANSQYPGKVMECSLVGQGWESLGKLGKDGHALYHVVIISVDDPNPMFTHVMVNAVDGTIYKVEREERRTESSRREPISGGVLNDRAISLPNPNYPVIARAAQASGTVTVEIMVDEQGNVIAAHAISGHPLLQSASVDAARQAKFSPAFLTGDPVRVRGLLSYTFSVQ